MNVERGSRKYGMKTIVETLANDDLKCFYGMNRHSALGDAETLCLLSQSKSLGARFSSWVIGFQSLVGPSPMKKRKTLFRDSSKDNELLHETWPK